MITKMERKRLMDGSKRKKVNVLVEGIGYVYKIFEIDVTGDPLNVEAIKEAALAEAHESDSAEWSARSPDFGVQLSEIMPGSCQVQKVVMMDGTVVYDRSEDPDRRELLMWQADGLQVAKERFMKDAEDQWERARRKLKKEDVQ